MFKKFLSKYHNFHDALIKKIIIVSPNKFTERGVTQKSLFSIEIHLDYYKNKKLYGFKKEGLVHFKFLFKNVHNFKFSKSEYCTYLIFGIKLEKEVKLQKVIIDDFDEILCEKIEVEEL